MKPSLKHGRHAYIRYGCRCDICKDAFNAYQRAYMAKRMEEAHNGGREWFRYNPTRSNVTLGLALDRFRFPGEWTEHAACKGSKVLDIPLGYMYHLERWPGLQAARTMCAGCPVLEQCRNWVMSHDDDPCSHHVVAGLAPTERNSIRRVRGTPTTGRPAKEGAA